jgi:hypothetical protein
MTQETKLLRHRRGPLVGGGGGGTSPGVCSIVQSVQAFETAFRSWGNSVISYPTSRVLSSVVIIFSNGFSTSNSQHWATPLGPNNYKDTKPYMSLYWYLIEFIDWRYSQLCWYFRPLLWTSAPRTLGGGGGGGYRVVWRVSTGVIHCIWPDSKPKKMFHHPKQKTMRGGGLTHLPPSPFTGKFLRKADI